MRIQIKRIPICDTYITECVPSSTLYPNLLESNELISKTYFFLSDDEDDDEDEEQ